MCIFMTSALSEGILGVPSYVVRYFLVFSCACIVAVDHVMTVLFALSIATRAILSCGLYLVGISRGVSVIFKGVYGSSTCLLDIIAQVTVGTYPN